MTRAFTLTELLQELRAKDVRVWEENGELRVRAPGGVLSDELRQELRRQKEELLTLLIKSRASETAPIATINRGGDMPLSSAQRRLWFLEQIRDDGPSAYNISTAFIAEGLLKLSALEAALGDVVERHEVLRMGVRNDNGEPKAVWSTTRPVIDFADFSAQEDAENLFRADAKRLAETPFDLAAPPLIRFALRRLGPHTHGVAIVIHHIVTDGESMPILMHDLAALYAARLQDRAADLAPLRIQYADFAAWQHAQADDASLTFWRRQFKDAADPLELPTEGPRPATQSFVGDTVHFTIPADVVGALNAAGRSAGASLFMTLLAATTTLLQRWTNQDDITIGTPARGRAHADLEGQVGCYVNTVALRCHVDRTETFTQLLNRVRTSVTDAFDHASYPFDRLVDQLGVHRDTGRSPLFDVMLSVAPDAASSLSLEGVQITPIDLRGDVSQLDLTFNFAASKTSNAALDASIQFRTDLFARTRIERLAEHFTVLLTDIAQDPSRPLRRLKTLPAAEEQRVVTGVNSTTAPHDRSETIIGRFIAQVGQTPKAIAVIDGERQWTYEEIDARSNAVAHRLIAQGVGVESRVALLTLRGEAMMTGLLGIMKAGAAYVPIQPTDPAQRIEELIADCRPAAVLKQADITAWAAETTGRSHVDVRSDNLAYVIYTSGSTGKPKGVLIQHGSVVNRIVWMDREYGLQPGDVILQKTPYTFDVSVWELFWWVFSGATVAFLTPDAEKDPALIVDAIDRHRVTKMHFVPSMLRAFLDHVEHEGVARLSSLRDVFASGEALPADLVTRFHDLLTRRNGTKLHNLYGPTEATVDVSYFDCANLGDASVVPIGAPVANTQLYVLDRDLQPSPLGVAGEIFIGGVNVGRGYLNRADLTADRFVPDPWAGSAGGRLYRTGDLGRWRDDGQLEYLGRNDHQVKVRGNRIELGEIESVLLSHPDIRNAVVLARDEQLIAYVMGAAEISAIRSFLTERLPNYMAPTRFVTMDHWPLTTSGKLNRRALPSPDAGATHSDRMHVEPRTDTERILASVFANVLAVAVVGVDDDFFERGGHSLMATRVVAHARQEHGLDINLRDLFARPTVAALAECADSREPFRGLPLRRVEAQVHYPVSHAQRRLWLAEQRAPNAAAYNVAAAFTISGALDIAALEEAWRRIQARHESLRTCFIVVDGEPRQQIVNAPEIRVDFAELLGGSFADEAARIAAIPFNLTRAPLVRMSVRQLAPNEFGWIVVMHHIVCDGWSMPILVRELVMFYEDARAGRSSTLPPLRLQYKDYASWQRQLMGDEAMEPHRRFWRAMFDSTPPRVQLPFAVPSTVATAAERVILHLTAAKTTALRELGQRHGASVFMTLQTAVKTLLFRYTGQTDITVGTVTAGRIHPDVEKQIGFYVNTLALRSQLDAEESFTALLKRVSNETLDAFEHQAYPFDSLVDDLDIPADGRFPLFDVMIVLQNNETAEMRLPDLTLRSIELPASGNKFDLSFHFAETNGAIELTLEYRSDRFDRESMTQLGAEFSRLIDAVLVEPDRLVNELPLPAGAVREQTVAVVSTFTAEPIEEPLAFWMAQLGHPTRIAFAPFGQVFQELLDPSSLIGRNRDGANVALIRLSDWDHAPSTLVPTRNGAEVFSGHDTHTLPNGADVAHLNSYETEDVYQEIFVDRVYARHGITLRDNDVVFDIGANIGLFSLFATASAKNLKIFGFEPAPATFEALRRNVTVYSPGAQVFNCGIGAVEGQAPFTFYPKSSVFSSYHPDASADAASIRAIVRNVVEREGDASASAVAAATDVFMADRMQAETVLVPIRTLAGIIRDHNIERIDLLKLDAEKSERGILGGLGDADWQKIQQLVMEVHDSDGETLKFISRLLTEHGFHIIVEEESRLHESGLFTIYGRRTESAPAPTNATSDNIGAFCAALSTAAQRTPNVPFVVMSCPDATPRTDGSEELLAQGLATIPGVAFVSAADLADAYPVAAPHDLRADKLGSIPYTPEMFAAMATAAARRIEAAKRPPFKVIVLDADQTLWRGVVGEDGADGISLDPPRRALQEFMAAQRRAGMLLCLCSKNDEDDVRRAFEAHPDWPLTWNDFAAARVNWLPKSENIRSLAAQLSLGIDSFIFVDDNPIECAEVSAACPDVFTLQLPEDIERILAFLRATWAFDRAASTAEDAKRADFYSAAGDRDRLRTDAPTLSAFIAGLNLQIDITALSGADVARAAQLTQRTNQFNTTTIRRTDAEVAALGDHGRSLSVVRVRDRFGDYGLVGVVIYGADDKSMVIDGMMLSCRALGRGVEHAMLAHVGREAMARGLDVVDARFASTSKNSPARDFLNSLDHHTKIVDDSALIYRMTSVNAAQLTFTPSDAPVADDVITDDIAASIASVQPTRSTRAIVSDRTLIDAGEIASAAAAWSLTQHRGGKRTRRATVVQPRTRVEKELAAIWSTILGVGSVGTDESFFDLGGHSLKAIRMLSKAAQIVGAELTLGDLFADPTIAGLASRASSTDTARQLPIPVAPIAPHYALSGAQRRLWILSELGGNGTVAYNVPAAFVLDGELSVDALNDAFTRLIARHESLRTRFIVIDGEPRQEIVADPSFALERSDRAPMSEAEFIVAAAELAHEPLSFDAAPLLRSAVYRIDANRWGLAIVIHHVVTDAWSMPILVRELFEFYDDARQGRVSVREPLRVHYKDYAAWQNDLLASPATQAHQEFWQQQFAETPPAIDLPADGPRAAVQDFRGESIGRHFDRALSQSLHDLSKRHGATLFMTLLAAVNVLLYRYSGETDITVGSPMTGRVHPDLEDQVGFYVNTLALRTKLSPRETFASLLDRVRESTADAFRHEAYPFDRLVDELRLPRNLGRSPLFDVMLVVEQDEQSALSLPGVAVRSVGVRHDVSRFDLTFHFAETANGIELGVQFSSTLFKTARVETLCRHLETLLRQIVRNESCPIGDVAIVDEAERRLLTHDFSTGSIHAVSNGSLSDLFRAQVERTPGNTAVIDQDGTALTYRELDRRSDRVAQQLLTSGISPEEIVGVSASRSTFTVIAMLGIMKAGGAYLPLDPSLPQARLDFMIADSGATRILRNHLGDMETSNDVLHASMVKDQLAYVIYTSGSTGQPKGVGVTHAALVNMALDQIRSFALRPSDVLAQFSSIGFDASLYETFLALLSGATLAIVPDDARMDPQTFLAWIDRTKPTALVLPPAFVRTFERAPLGSVRLLVTAGEAADAADAQKYAAELKYVNAYGPTEFAVCATTFDVPANVTGPVSIGRPIANATTYVLDTFGSPSPIGVPGELYLGGAGVARGYLNRPDLTADRFVPDSFSTTLGARLYRTGDLARWRSDGTLEFIGRNDDQVKVRGHRIELGEVENMLRSHTAVRDAVVIARELDLVAYVTGDSVAADAVKSHVRQHLPEYMVPAHVIHLDALPLNASGKIDRRALPAPDLHQRAATTIERPSTEIERAIAEVWCAVLGVPRVGVLDSFFDLGGNSILLARVLSALRKDIAPALSLIDLFTYPRIQDLAAHLSPKTASRDADAGARVASRAEKQRAALAQTRKPKR